ncbi:SWI/SNF-related matrix-associated actin-dependent regulator of chromatin subfamily A containing DEAD/H box 1A [Clupea harengus]|uniref:DNA helicase n=1 Tax=Clupea harengus TaxID=7950 RepID=A0A6P8FTG5_CLUHA|nr:SWI/SNF-related matrix-associated actin-dependent regulator of chromatin subfamily A containing DEAD/H box 1A [Clupea harengus]
MSLFNLDRFRFQRDEGTISFPKSKKSTQEDVSSDSASPTSDKENKPESTKQDHKLAFKRPFKKKVGGDDSDDDTPQNGKLSQGKTKPYKKENDEHSDEEGEENQKLETMQEMFPQRDRNQLLELIRCTGTLDGAVALCLMQYGDKGTPRQRKRDVLSEDDEEDDGDLSHPTKKRRADLSEDSQESDDSQEAESESDDTVDSEDESFEPNREKQEHLVQRLKKKLPDLDKEVLRDVLQEHEWHYEDALGALRMFADSEVPSSSKKKSSQPKDSIFSKAKKGSSEPNKSNPKNSSSKQAGTSPLSQWLWKVPGPSGAQKVKAKQGESSKAKDRKPAEKRPAKPTPARKAEVESEDEEEEEQALSSQGEEELTDGYNSDEDEPISSEQQREILKFFQEAAVHELTLISGCSVKRADKIVSLRPFKAWKDLDALSDRDNGLPPGLLEGCRVVLKERQVVQQLMGKCEGISRKMLKDATVLIERGTGSTKQPAILNRSMKLQSYQLIGLKWLTLLHQHKLSGILADEMGLGKTVQAIAFLAHLLEKGITGPHLITVPSSTLDNWVRELRVWCPTLKVLVYYGSIEDRKYLRRDILDKQVDFNVIVCTYNSTLGTEFDRSLFRKLRLKYAIFDEGHMLKNMNSQRYRYLMAVNAQHRLLLTGTPLQNNLLELMSLLNFIMPSMFSSSTAQIARIFSSKGDKESSYNMDRIDQAKRIMKPFILRRVKSEVLKELPPKEEKVERCSMTAKQKELYTSLFNKFKRTIPGEKKELNNVMMQLRKMANHPMLHRQYYTTEKLAAMSQAMLKEPTHFDADAALIQEDMAVMSDFELHNLCLRYPSVHSHKLQTEVLLDSGKFDLLTRLLASLKKKGDRVVLFSQFTMVLDIVELLMKHLDHRYIRLDGSTPIAERIGLIDNFNNDPEIFVFLLSTRAGGQGINLTSANVVILHDIDCNPYNDKQAEDRCHRMGQTRTVKVIKLVSKDSIEDVMLRVGQEKLKLEECMTTSDTGDNNSMPEDMALLLRVSLGL